MSDITRLAAMASTYTPGTVTDRPQQNGSTGYPPSPATGQVPMAFAVPNVPVVGIVAIVVILFLLERRHLKFLK